MNQMHIDNIELVVIEFERQLATALVTHYSTHSGCNGALLLIFQLLSVMSPYKSDEEHLPEADLPNCQEVEFA
jgi:hypothetical protein